MVHIFQTSLEAVGGRSGNSIIVIIVIISQSVLGLVCCSLSQHFDPSAGTMHNSTDSNRHRAS